MKKLLMLAATTAVISSSSAFAHMLDMNNEFYLKAAVGVSKLRKFNLEVNDQDFNFKTKYRPVLNLAVGYYLMDNVRAELEVGYLFNPKARASISNTVGTTTTTSTVHDKPRIMTLMLSAYADLVDLDMVKLFVGGGLGVAAVKEKVSLAVDVNGTVNPALDLSDSSKRKYNLSGQLTLGASTKITDEATVELAGRYHYYGKSKGVENVAAKYKAYSLSLGFRFAM